MKPKPQTYTIEVERFSTKLPVEMYGYQKLDKINDVIRQFEIIFSGDLKRITVYRDGPDKQIWMFRITFEKQSDGSGYKRT